MTQLAQFTSSSHSATASVVDNAGARDAAVALVEGGQPPGAQQLQIEAKVEAHASSNATIKK